MTQALVAEGGAAHELMAKLAPIAPQGHLHVELGQFVGTVKDVNSLAIGTNVVGQVPKFTFGAGVSTVVAITTLLTLEGPFAKADV